jgi:cytochrome P450
MKRGFRANDILFGKGLLSTLGSSSSLLPFSLSLMKHEGDHHRKQRKMLNPVFSTAHMRQMSKDVLSYQDVSHHRLFVSPNVLRGDT